MKRVLSILLIIFMILPLFALDENIDPNADNVLNIKGYKVGEDDYMKIVITDAISESLDVLDRPKEDNRDAINVSDHIDNLLGTTGADFNSLRSVFSYRVVGNITGSFRIDMTFNPLMNTAEGGTHTIGATYALGSLSYTFPEISSQSDGQYTIASTSGEENILQADPSGTNNTLTSYWSVTPRSENATTQYPWSHRGTVAMTISESDYSNENIPVGTYTALVEVKLYVLY